MEKGKNFLENKYGDMKKGKKFFLSSYFTLQKNSGRRNSNSFIMKSVLWFV